jgi:hypothetical protein
VLDAVCKQRAVRHIDLFAGIFGGRTEIRYSALLIRAEKIHPINKFFTQTVGTPKELLAEVLPKKYFRQSKTMSYPQTANLEKSREFHFGYKLPFIWPY